MIVDAGIPAYAGDARAAKAAFGHLCSSVMEKLLFTKVITLILIHSEALKVTQRHEMPTVVKPPRFYYFLTTNDCRDLPPNASFCHFGLFSVTE